MYRISRNLPKFPIQKWAVALLIGSFYFSPVSFHLGVVPIYIPEIVLLILFFIFVARYRLRFFGEIFRSNWFFGWMGLFSGALFSFVGNPITSAGMGILKSFFFFPLLFVWIMDWCMRSGERKSFILLLWFWIGALVSYGALGTLFFGMVTFDHRLSAWFPSPNFLSMTLIFPGIIGIWHLSRLWRAAKKNYFFLTALFGWFPIIVTILLTRSYAGFAAILAGGSIYLFFRLRNRIVFLILFAFLAGSFFFFESGSEKWQSFISGNDRSSFSSRGMIWQSSIRIWQDNPVLGIGPGRFQEEYLSYQKFFPPYLEWAVPQPHNIWFAFALQTGVVGLLSLIFLIGRSIYSILYQKNALSWAILSIWIGWFVIGLVDTPYFRGELVYSFWLLVAISVYDRRRKSL